MEVNSIENHAKRDSLKTEEKRDEVELRGDVTNDLLNFCDIWWGGFDSESWMIRENTHNNSYSSSFSLQNCSNPSMGESPSIQENSLHQWVESVDSILPWDGFNHLEQDLFFLEPMNIPPSVP